MRGRQVSALLTMHGHPRTEPVNRCARCQSFSGRAWALFICLPDAKTGTLIWRQNEAADTVRKISHRACVSLNLGLQYHPCCDPYWRGRSVLHARLANSSDLNSPPSGSADGHQF